MTPYQDNQLLWLSSPEHHAECHWIHPELHQLEVTFLGIEPARPTYQEYGVKREVANRVAADLGALDLALDAFSSGPPPIFGYVRSTGAPRTLHGRSTGVRIKIRCGSIFPEWTSQGRLRRSARTAKRHCWLTQWGVLRGKVSETRWSS